MKKKIIIRITGALFASAILIFILYALSNQLNHRYNNFTRLFPPHLVDRLAMLDIQYNSYQIAGTAHGNIYLSNNATPLNLLKIDTSLTDTQHVQLKIKDFEKFKFRAIAVTIDSPYFYLTDGTVPAILRGQLGTYETSQYIEERTFFSTALPISSTSLALTMISSTSNETILAKKNIHTPQIQIADSILEKQVDGIFCTEGQLHYTPDLNYLVYLYRYRNQYICMDTSLNVIYKGNTIDSISQAQIKVAKIKSDNSITLAAPPLTVNRQGRVSRNWLFVNSNLLSKNENKETFAKSSVIDIYNLKNGQYEFSFYMQDYYGGKMRDFKVYGDKIVALFGNYLYMYKLNMKYFNLKQ